MICPECGQEIKSGEEICSLCGAKIEENAEYHTDTATADDKRQEIKPQAEEHTKDENYTEDKDDNSKKSSIGIGFYKFLCVCMGIVLVAGTIIWAVLFLRDRMDSKLTVSSSASENSAVESNKSEATATTTTAATTATTTTADPYSVAVEPQTTDDYGTLYVTVDELAMRIGPGYDYEKLETSISSGTALEVTSEQYDSKSAETWCYVTYDDVSGWVCLSYLSETNPSVAVVLPDELYTGSDREWMTVIRSGGVKLYSGPDEDYEVLATIDEGEEIQKEGYNYLSVKWLYTCYNGQYGWIITYDGDWLNPTIE